jgi:hypothetical protein
MSLTTSEVIKIVEQLKEYVSLSEKRNGIIESDAPIPLEKRIDLLRINNQANASMKKLLDYFINILEEEDRYWNQQADLEKEAENDRR